MTWPPATAFPDASTGRSVRSPFLTMFKGVVRSRTVALVTCRRRPAPAGSSTCTLVPEEHTLAGNLDDVPLPPAVTVVVAPDITPTSEKRTLYVPGKRCPNEYVPSDAVVVVTGAPFTRTGLPAESSRVTVAPATGVVAPVTVAVPDRVAPHWALDGAEIVTPVETGLRVVVLFDESVDAPDAPAVIDVAASPVSGPVPVGHASWAVGVRHNCGASPIAATDADAVPVAVRPVNSTLKTGSCPVTETEADVRSTDPDDRGYE